ncbi:MAG: type II toxin-antitoxin system PemK/MazF family toxin [Bryobacterales bacterium]|nr:type II toxin-antitoxin system PemK/MazF family toxin [Bryobacterales bacterium]
MTPNRGEVWLFDLGMAEKVRPALILSVGFGERDRALVTVVPHTTALRGSPYEVVVPVPFLKPGAFLVQNLATYPTVRAIRKLGVLKQGQLDVVAPVCCSGWVTETGCEAGLLSLRHRANNNEAGNSPGRLAGGSLTASAAATFSASWW